VRRRGGGFNGSTSVIPFRSSPLPSCPPEVFLDGVGLRSGRTSAVVLSRSSGPFAFIVDGTRVPLAGVVAVSAERATVVRAGGAEVATVEHLLAACAAFGLHEGLSVEVRGGEVPLLDGGAAAFARALASLDLSAVAPRLEVVRDEVIQQGESRYTFRRASATASPAARVSVTIAFGDPRLSPEAAWNGTRDDFVQRIAAARTFAFSHEVAELAARGHASHVDPESVVLIADAEVLSRGRPFTEDEPARHKLLDLMGDLFLYGGPPRGEVHALRPGHATTHAVMRRALAAGIVA
jgi:UDP-3-O-[3-hydroxymyristoyl] N-acetylglucosamine deacetylase